MKQTEQWSSRLGFILSAAGSAVGLGAIWKFPYVAGVNGGGAFFFLFLVFTILFGLPLLLAEFVIGRHTQKNAIQSYKVIAPQTKWHLLGYLGLIANFIILSFYSVIGGWIILYIYKTVAGQLSGLTVEQYQTIFADTIADPFISLIAHLLFMLLTIVIVARGIQNGIERANKIMMPALFILFLLLIVRSLTLTNISEGLRFLFLPDFTKVTAETILAALGQALFTLSLGVSTMLTYSSYVPKSESLPRSALSIVSMNILIVILAGLAIFPAVFSFGLTPDAGPVLLFEVLPNVFSQLPLGMFFFFAFLILFLFAALTSALSMLEMIVSNLAKGSIILRKKWSWIIGIVIFIAGIPSALSFGVIEDWKLFGKTFFDLVDYLVSNMIMPIGALFISVFVPFKMRKDILIAELQSGGAFPRGLFKSWFFIIRFIVPAAILLILLNMLEIW
ncbi:sodium-dependent transporter [Bacillus kwashiorkori]|uniref:sodium-dependent transporter n=1 Tax=Bacillus kwashiorkori TaxID=1522318 RepID=UPI0007850480|nr:sodium-dependent transporter [Bacillus kwashiorkori]